MSTMTTTETASAAGFIPALTQRLTDEEREEIEWLAVRLSAIGSGRVDDLAWLAEARRLSCRVPLRVRETIRQYRHDPGPDGLLVLSNLPVDASALPRTPTISGSVERAATVPSCISALLSLQLGEMIAFSAEKSGALVQNVVPVPGFEASQSNAGSVNLTMHTENAFHANRPDFVSLLCLRADHTESAGTTVSPIRRALPLIPPGVREVLAEPRYVTEPPPSFQSGGSAEPHPLLSTDAEDPNIRVDFAATSALDGAANHAMERLREAIEQATTSLVLRSGDIVFIDNRVTLHGRTYFEPRYDGQDRWLHRTFVHLDNRRSRIDRPGNGAVLN